jgi:hypothetical protein
MMLSNLKCGIVPESFTHGTSEQRKYWFMKGYKTGDIKQGNTLLKLDKKQNKLLKIDSIPIFFVLIQSFLVVVYIYPPSSLV